MIIIGALMVFVLFAALFVGGGLLIGWKRIVCIYLAVGGLVAWVALASYLLSGGVA